MGKGRCVGVTVVHHAGKANPDPVFASWFTLKATGDDRHDGHEAAIWKDPSRSRTRTASAGARQIIKWEGRRIVLQPWWLQVVARRTMRVEHINGST